MGIFKLKAPFGPRGDQGQAIELLSRHRPEKSLLLGVTGSGKTFTIANLIANQDRQVLVLSPNKTLAAQLYEEFSLFFPENKVCYFVSYYDYYQPESYVPSTDTYIAKETKINDQIERLRIEATASLVNRRDVIVISSVSAIYSLGNPTDYRDLALQLRVGSRFTRHELLQRLVGIQYVRNDVEHEDGTFQVNGGAVIVRLPYQRDAVRIELFGDQVDSIELLDKKNMSVVGQLDNAIIFPAKHFVVPAERVEGAMAGIEQELHDVLPHMENELYRQRLETRVKHDLAMMKATGYCSGIENYSRYFDGRLEGDKPHCLMDFFDDEFLLVIDESHIAVPQLGAMYKGDRSRKQSLIDYGFRLPSAVDNRPLKFDEVEQYFNNVVFVSATPGSYEKAVSTTVAEQIVRPTGIVDPRIEIVKREGQLDHLANEIRATSQQGFRTLITTLTKKSSEALAHYLEEKRFRVCYLHSEIKTPERSEILGKLRDGTFECLVGINLLREGLDLPEVALVAILDADVEGFLRNERSLIQTIGRAARNTASKVILYADRVTDSMKAAMSETDRRRTIQMAYNLAHGITPTTTSRSQASRTITSHVSRPVALARPLAKKKTVITPKVAIEELKRAMMRAAEDLDFERAIALRDEIQRRLHDKAD